MHNSKISSKISILKNIGFFIMVVVVIFGLVITLTNKDVAAAIQTTNFISASNAAITLWGHGVIGSAPPANATYAGYLTAGVMQAVLACRSSKFLDMSTATTTEIISASGSTAIYICSIAQQAGGTTTATLKYGTSTNCGSGTTSLGAAWDWTAQTGISRGSGIGVLYTTPASQAVCVTNSANVNLHTEITYTQF